MILVSECNKLSTDLITVVTCSADSSSLTAAFNIFPTSFLVALSSSSTSSSSSSLLALAAAPLVSPAGG